MIFIRPATSHHPCTGAEFYRHPACGKMTAQSCRQDNDKNKDKISSSSNSESRVFVERSPIHFKETEEAATIALDVAGYAPEDVQVRMDDFVVSIDAERVNKLGDTYKIRRRFRVDKTTVLEDEVQASLTDGILEVVVPKKAKVGPRSIPITTIQSVTASTATDDEKKDSEKKRDHSDTEEDEVEAVEGNGDEDSAAAADEEVQVEAAQPVVEEDSWEEVKD